MQRKRNQSEILRHVEAERSRIKEAVNMHRLRAKSITTNFWRPGEDYITRILESIKGKIEDGDMIVISEKALSTSSGNIVEETKAEPSCCALFVAKFWMRIAWGYFLGTACHLKPWLILQLRNYPIGEGSKHKQVALRYSGVIGALMFGSEGAIDGSNLAYSYVSLPLKQADRIAENIRQQVAFKLNKRVCIMISDTDKTYSIRNFHFTPRPFPIRGIRSFGGVFTLVAARILRLQKRATPVAITGCRIDAENALRVAEIANKARGVGAGGTVWDMAKHFNVTLTSVTWEMLETVKHKPIVIVKTRT